MSLYEKIITQEDDTDVKAFLCAINLSDGWELLDKVPLGDRKNKMAALKYCARLFDPESELQLVSDRFKAKTTELKSLGVDYKDKWVDIVIGKCQEFNDLVAWYLQTVAADEPLRKALMMVKELMHHQMTEAMTYPEEKFIDQKGKEQDLPEEKRLKNMAYKQDCAEKYIENIERIEDLERRIQTKYEKSDENFRNEIQRNIEDRSGATERWVAKNLKQKT